LSFTCHARFRAGTETGVIRERSSVGGTDEQEIEDGRTGQLELARRYREGTAVKKLTSPTSIKGHKVTASADNPEYLVETDDGKRAAHKAEAPEEELILS